MERYFAAEKPDEVWTLFRNNSSVRFVSHPVPLVFHAASRQRRRRSLQEFKLMISKCAAGTDAYNALLTDVVQRAQRDGIVVLVPTSVLEPRNTRPQSKTFVRQCLRQERLSRELCFLSGSASGRAIREALRKDFVDDKRSSSTVRHSLRPAPSSSASVPPCKRWCRPWYGATSGSSGTWLVSQVTQCSSCLA